MTQEAEHRRTPARAALTSGSDSSLSGAAVGPALNARSHPQGVAALGNGAESDYFTNPPPRRHGALGLLTRGEDEFAVIQRSYWTPIARWGLPGGSVAPDERPWTGLTRLIETKLDLRVTPAAFLGVDHAPTKPGDYEEGVNFLYHVPLPPHAQLRPVVGTGYVEARWVTSESVRELAVDHELLRIEQCLDALRTHRPRELVLGVPQHQRLGMSQAPTDPIP